jgi:hypothetical protein
VSLKIFANSANESLGPTTGYVFDAVFWGPKRNISWQLVSTQVVWRASDASPAAYTPIS